MESSITSELDIVLAVYNGEKYLKEQIDSIISQNTSLNWRLIISDDGSTDSSYDIIFKYVALDNRIIFLEDNFSGYGPLGRFSWLAERTTAPYIMFCDQDDVWLENKIERSYEVIKAAEDSYGNYPILVHTDLTVIDIENNILSPSFIALRGIDPNPSLQRLLVENPVTGCTILINRNVLELALPIPRGVYMHDWWLALVAKTCGRLIYIDEPTILYRQHDANSIGVRKVTYIERIQRLRYLWSDNSAQLMYERSYTQAYLLKDKLGHTMFLESKNIINEFLEAFANKGMKKKLKILRGNFLQKSILRRIFLLLRIK